jgi:hypothetical protein
MLEAKDAEHAAAAYNNMEFEEIATKAWGIRENGAQVYEGTPRMLDDEYAKSPRCFGDVRQLDKTL